MSIAQNLSAIRERIERAAGRAGRSPDEILLIGASKRIDIDKIREAHAAGLTVCGENRVQELQEKVPQIGSPTAVGATKEGADRVPDTPPVADLRWHLIGPLQRNKARKAIELVELIHSLDSLRLGETLDRLGTERVGASGRPVEALIEVNVGGETSKAGIAPDELLPLAEELSGREGLRIRGLMTIPPPTENPDAARPYFQKLRALLERLRERDLPGVEATHLSMGMSGDYEVAIEEGATMVRVGTALFGPRPPLTPGNLVT